MIEFIQLVQDRWPLIVQATIEHISLSLVALLISVLISVPIGIILTRVKVLAGPVLGVVSVFQTIPSLAILGFMIPLFGIGTAPAIVAMVIYALLPIMRNTYTGIEGVDHSILDAGKGMGMTKWQMLFLIELPLARNVIFAGIRTATVMIVGVATLGTFIGAGGLGDLIMRGIQTVNTGLILAGAIPAALLAILFDNLLALTDRWITPKGLRVQNGKLDQ